MVWGIPDVVAWLASDGMLLPLLRPLPSVTGPLGMLRATD